MMPEQPEGDTNPLNDPGAPEPSNADVMAAIAKITGEPMPPIPDDATLNAMQETQAVHLYRASGLSGATSHDDLLDMLRAARDREGAQPGPAGTEPGKAPDDVADETAAALPDVFIDATDHDEGILGELATGAKAVIAEVEQVAAAVVAEVEKVAEAVGADVGKVWNKALQAWV